ncbi:interferon-like [Elgaria multicarinata webbii]|uniref:interferon-like n=1 Tax=Elgaria multicarinata webbii TaxID=159646 RepID=UPI002FCD182D
MACKRYRLAGFMCLLLLLPAQVTALDCNFLKLQQQRFNSDSLELLKGMRMKHSPECLENMTAFDFPKKIVEIHQPWLATKAVHEILHGFFGILSSDLLQTSWAAAHRERFLNMLYAQTESIERCLAEAKRTRRRKDEWKNKLRLRKYFQRIRSFLKEKEHSRCSWESVKRELWTSFVYINILTKRMAR